MNLGNDANITKHIGNIGRNTCTRPGEKESARQWNMEVWGKAWSPLQLPGESDIADNCDCSEVHRRRLRPEDDAKQRYRKLLV